MRFPIRPLILFAFMSYFLGACSGVKFSQNLECEKNGTCVVQNGKAVYPAQDYTVDGGKVDVLMVDDNSASMSFEQNRMSARFNQFIQNLENKGVNYRIAFTTTDISSSQNAARAINGNGALQDGKLIALSSGKKFLSKEDGDLAAKTTIFKTAIERKETLSCETFINNWMSSGKTTSDASYSTEYYNNCPSGDERGIYAANLVTKNNPDGFLRDDADFHIIFLSDEDERSQLYLYGGQYSLEDMDKGKTLASTIRTTFPSKTFGIHPIITADAYCLPIQNQQMSGIVSGTYGTEYNNARKEALSIVNAERSQKGLAAVKMVLGDICLNDYAGQLTEIFDNVVGPIVDSYAIKCSNPEGLNITVSTSDSSISHELVGNVIKFNKKLPVGTRVSVSSYSCPAE
ncbi:MAG: hypothetical protein B7Y39_15635 [Bdellovibrio sp. 28-41-41]|nr:MAG: hypothetical protein B7Y39_15635 [Bdellovibrio sp. 28-41-41]